MGTSEPTAPTESAGERQRDVFDSWLGLYTSGITAQTNAMGALARASIRTGQLLQRQNAALARQWMRAATGPWGTRRQALAEPSGRSPTDEQRQEEGVAPATAKMAPPVRAIETATESPAQEATREEPLEPAPESAGGAVAATANRSATEERDAASDLDRLETLGPVAAEKLRSADVHTIEELARARTKDLAAETGLHPRRIRVWVFRARRVGDR